jgi:hypothetical protein
MIALTVAGIASASCCIPPRHALVVTSCGKVDKVYVYNVKGGFAAYDGPVAVRMAQYIPANKRVDSGCKR